MTQARRLAGRKAQNNGKEFEAIFKTTCAYLGVSCTRIPDGCKQIGIKKLIRVKSPFDFIISYKGKSANLDTKTSNTASFANSMIDEDQVLEMLKHEMQGVTGGYVIWLRKTEKVIFFPASALAARFKVIGSIDETDPEAIELGSCTAMDITKIFKTSNLTDWMQKEINGH